MPPEFRRTQVEAKTPLPSRGPWWQNYVGDYENSAAGKPEFGSCTYDHPDSWFTFFLHDYTRRIEAAAANILLFIAFSWSLASNYPRLGYITFLDAIMAVTFAVNVLVLLYNVYMKRLENEGKAQRVERIDNVLDWLYPLLYVALIGMVILLFFWPRLLV